jgi:hypothetical protein
MFNSSTDQTFCGFKEEGVPPNTSHFFQKSDLQRWLKEAVIRARVVAEAQVDSSRGASIVLRYSASA